MVLLVEEFVNWTKPYLCVRQHQARAPLLPDSSFFVLEHETISGLIVSLGGHIHCFMLHFVYLFPDSSFVVLEYETMSRLIEFFCLNIPCFMLHCASLSSVYETGFALLFCFSKSINLRIPDTIRKDWKRGTQDY